MDSVTIDNYKTRFSRADHPMIFVNGASLDELLERELGDENLGGLVPSITWLWDEEEKSIAIERFSDETIGCIVVPILVCPDDADFSCSVLMVEVEQTESSVLWNRFGFDKSSTNQIGTTISWYKSDKNYEFSKSEYTKFKNELIKLGRIT